jgi:hypothetical protein
MDNHTHSKDGNDVPQKPKEITFEHLIRPTKTRLQIADEYKNHPRTLKRRLEQLGVKLPSGDLYPKHQRLIYETLGPPPID